MIHDDHHEDAQLVVGPGLWKAILVGLVPSLMLWVLIIGGVRQLLG